MNFQAVSVGEKLTPGGYLDAAGTPSPLLATQLAFVDASLGKMVAELEARHLADSTLIIVEAKHGQSPIDKTKLAMEAGGNGNATVQDPLPTINTVDPNIGAHPSPFVNPNSGIPYDTKGHFQTDDVGILWMEHTQDSTKASAVADALQGNAAAIFADTLPPGTVFSQSITTGAALAEIFGDPNSGDPVAAARAPDLFIQPNWGTIYSGSSKKIAEHGGGTLDDTHVALIVSNPGLHQKLVKRHVDTTQIAPTILRTLGLNPFALEGVVKEHTQLLPGLGL
jgi:arylsulfatase A-like enzyme